MASQLEVFNKVGTHLSQPVMTVVSPSPSNEFSRALNAHWTSVVRTCLSETNFHFAMKRMALPRLAAAPDFGFLYYYQKPADCIRMIMLSQTGSDFDRMPPNSYTEESGKIAASVEALYLFYVTTEAIDTPGRWLDLFADFVALRMAKLLAPKFNSGAAEAVAAELKIIEKKAIAVDATQGPTRTRRPGSWSSANRSRGGRGWGGSGLPEMQ